MEKRRQAIRDMVDQLGEVNFAQLRELFPSVSDVTLRKDLKYLDESKQILRVHGGAKSLPHILNHHMRASLHQEEKHLIGLKAAKLVNPNDSIFITAGSTCIELASNLPAVPCYVCSDGIGTVANIPYSQDIHVEILGGDADLNIMRVCGPSVLAALEDRHFHTAFFGTPGFHPEHGFSIFSSSIAAAMYKVIENSDRVVVLMDSSKVNYSYTPRMIPLDAVDIVVSDDRLDPQIKQRLEDRGITVL